MPDRKQTWSRLRPDARRAEIFAVARSAFARSGYSSTSMASIGREAGVTPALVNHYFGAKQDLYLAVIDQSVENLSHTVRTDLRHLSMEERMARNTNEFLDSIERDREDWMLLFGARAQGDPRLAQRIERVREETIERMVSNQAGAAEPSEDLRLTMRVFQGTAEAATLEWVLGRATREQIEKLLITNLRAIVEANAGQGE